MYYMDSTRKIGKSPKLKSDTWRGPCVVVNRFSDIIYEIKAQQKGRTKVLHHDRLKPFLSDEIPEWMRQLSFKLKKDKKGGTITKNDTPRSGSSTSKPGRSPLAQSGEVTNGQHCGTGASEPNTDNMANHEKIPQL